jgi:Flp pilus assembly protein TadG
MKNDPYKTAGRRAQRGVAAVEMAIVMVVMLLITAGMIEFGRTFWYFNALSKATRGAARVVSGVSTTDLADATKRAAALESAQNLAVSVANGAGVRPAISTGNVLITCDGGSCGAASPGNVTVSISGFNVSLGAWFPFVSLSNGSLGTVSLAPSTTMRYMN